MDIVQIGFTRAEGRILDQICNIAHDTWTEIEGSNPDDLNRLHSKVLAAAKLFRDSDQLGKDTEALRTGDIPS
jgi:hypothetical protein